MRTPPEPLGADAEVALAEAIESFGIRLRPAAPGVDLSLDLGDGRAVDLQVSALTDARPNRVKTHVAASPPADGDRCNVLVADSIPATSRGLLRDERWGWFDRRGHLRLVCGALHIEAPVDSALRADGGRRAPIAGKAGVAAALGLLLAPDVPLKVRATAGHARLNASSVSRALTQLREQALVNPDGTPLVPELFWALADVWRTDPTPLRQRPAADDRDDATLRLNVADLDAEGWALSGTRGAVAWGVGLATVGDTWPDLVVPDIAAVRRARQVYGEAPTATSAAAVVRAAPTPLALAGRVQHADEPFPLAHPVVIALDLAGDRSRGLEALDGWTPPDPYVRVW